MDKMDFIDTTNTKIVWHKPKVKQLQKELELLQAENAELKKRLEKSVELPYKSGDTVYAIDKYKHYIKPCLIKHVIVDCYDIIFVTDSLTVNDELYEYNFYYYDIGKYVFLTKEEAEQKLKEMKK